MHLLHAVDATPPAVARYVPAGQCEQLGWPVNELYCPAAQLLHADAPVLDVYVPAEQERHTFELEALAVAEKVPAEQPTQLVWPVVGW